MPINKIHLDQDKNDDEALELQNNCTFSQQQSLMMREQKHNLTSKLTGADK